MRQYDSQHNTLLKKNLTFIIQAKIIIIIFFCIKYKNFL